MKNNLERSKVRGVYYVRVRAPDERLMLIKQLEADGFEIKTAGFAVDRADVINSIYPITVCVAERRYDRMSNTLCAACACSAGLVIEIEEFYEIYKGRN